MGARDDLDALLRFDPLHEAEQMTGKSYKEDRDTMQMGLGLHLTANKTKEAALRRASDSYFGMNLADTLALYASLGFVEVLRDQFIGRSYGDDPAPAETFHILWHSRDGLLATVESYNTTGRNSTKVYYNLQITDRDNFWSRTSSGHMASHDVWVGDHDAREGVCTKLAALNEVATFLPTWVERPWLWLLAYSETDGDFDYAAINAERIARLPLHVQAAIRGGEHS